MRRTRQGMLQWHGRLGLRLAWWLLLSVLPCSVVAAVVPGWTLEYFAGHERCDAWDTVSAPEHADLWKAVPSDVPVTRPVRLWLRLRSEQPIETDRGWVAAVRGERGHFLHHQLGDPAQRAVASRYQPGEAAAFGTRHLAVELPRRLQPQSPWLFCMVAPAGVSSAAFALYPEASFRAADLAQMQWVAACFAAMFTMMLSALLFGLRLRDPLYLWYVGHVAAFILFQSRTSWTLMRWFEGWPGMPNLGFAAAEFAIGLSAFCAVRFASVFLDLPRALPRMDRLARGVSLLVLLFGALGAVGRYVELPLGDLPRAAQNLFAALAALIVLLCALRLALSRRRYAIYFSIGWAPLLVIAAIATVNAAFFDRSASLLTEWLLPAGAFEALVLSLGMADRTLALRHERDAARRDAEIDPLTGVWNRRGMFRRLEQCVAADSTQAAGALLYCDLDFFKRINDHYGHDAGDLCLQHFAAVAQSALSAEDVLGRIGGEEFVLLMPAADLAAALRAAEHIRQSLRAQPVHWGTSTITLAVSIGIAELARGQSASAALSRADAALYRAKAEGRDRVCVA